MADQMTQFKAGDTTLLASVMDEIERALKFSAKVLQEKYGGSEETTMAGRALSLLRQHREKDICK